MLGLKKKSARKTGIAFIVALLAITAATGLLRRSARSSPQILADGSQLVLTRLSVENKNKFLHGRLLERLAGRLIPTNGFELLSFRLSQPSRISFDAPSGKTWLAAEFKLMGRNVSKHPLVKPALFRRFRCIIRGETGIEYAQEFPRRGFKTYPDGCYGYVVTSRFPRDSKWLWIRIERRGLKGQGGSWTTIAEFRTKNPSPAAIKPWVADPFPATKAANGMHFTLSEITVTSPPPLPRDIWNHFVHSPFQISSNRVALTNWSAASVRVEDASGNWDRLASHRSLDPRYIWKLDVDFQPESDFAPQWVGTLPIPPPNTTVTNLILNQALTLSSDGSSVNLTMATNRTDLALVFINVTDSSGVIADSAGHGSWDQYGFRKGDFSVQKDGVLHVGSFKPSTVTFAIVPSIRAEFFVQPRIVTGNSSN